MGTLRRAEEAANQLNGGAEIQNATRGTKASRAARGAYAWASTISVWASRGPWARVHSMATPPREAMAQPHTKDVVFIYGKLNGVDASEEMNDTWSLESVAKR